MRCIAAAIHNAFGEAVAGISISGPTVRFPDEILPGLGRTVAAAAREVTGADWRSAVNQIDDLGVLQRNLAVHAFGEFVIVSGNQHGKARLPDKRIQRAEHIG